jgi:lipoic acid synthetase
MTGRLPDWFKQKMPTPQAMNNMQNMLKDLHLHTVCQSALCPNIGQCFSKQTATFMILGDTCTRNCTFCAVNKGVPQILDRDEPENIAKAVSRLSLKHVVITSVTRDDLADGGANHFARVINRLKESNHELIIEVLIPDFKGSLASLEAVVKAAPEVVNHNIETVPRLYPSVRPMANFQRSVDLLANVKRINHEMTTKSGIMVGLGETREEILNALDALRKAECDLLTIGQYLQPSTAHHPIVRFVRPEEFADLARVAQEMGFRDVASAPLVRSSFNAAHLYSRSLSEAENVRI